MDQKCRLNKTELQEIKRLLENFVENDETIQFRKYSYDITEKITKRIQNLFEEEFLNKNILNWFKQYNINGATSHIYYNGWRLNHDKNRKYDTSDLWFDVGHIHDNLQKVIINNYLYGLDNIFEEKCAEKIITAFEEVYDEHLPELQKRIEKYENIMKEMVIVLNGLKTAQNILDKFGFIDSINKYINNLLSQQAKPISCMTKAVENSVDNYLSQRKKLDEKK